MVFWRSKPVARRALAAALISGGLAAPTLANPQILPATGPWSSGHYVEAIFAVQNGVITLPRQGNPKTEALFDRLIDRGNIEPLMRGPLSLAEKRRQILIILSATGEFRGRYGYAVALGDDLKNELVAIQIFRLYLIEQLAHLDMPEQTDGRRCASAVATTIFGTLDTLAEMRLFSTDQLVALSLAFERHYPAIRVKLDRKDQMALMLRLEGMAADERDPALRTAFTAALAAARGGN